MVGIDRTRGDVSASAVLWGTAGAAENTIVTAVTEPGSDLLKAAEEGFLSWGIGGVFGGILGKTVEIMGANGRSTLPATGTDSLDQRLAGGSVPDLVRVPGTYKTIGRDIYELTYQASVHNAESPTIMLGKFDPNHVSGYIETAGDDYSYFSLGADWDKIKAAQGLTDDDMFNLYNKRFLQDGIDAGKTFKFSHDPEGATGYLGDELKYLESHGYEFDQATMEATPR